jgi:UDP-N-acetylmuramyl pentapeptide phosphotransferase/UDP-N-acetylglucosamine-1-phosphate transferase
MMTAFIVLLFFLSNTQQQQIEVNIWSASFLMGTAVIYVVGIVDDLIGLNAQTKFVVQIIAASLLPFSGLYINNLYGFLGIQEIPFWFGAPFTVFIIVFIDNAINLIDGIDGLAGGLSFLALCGFLYCFLYEGIFTYSILIAGLMGVLLSYLYFNIWGNPSKNRKIFMGDSGSLTLGFILGFLFVKYAMYNPEVMPYHKDGLMISITMLIVPMFDVVRVVVMRLRKRRPLFDADKNHIHHKLMRAGLSQHKALAAILAIALAFAAVNFAMVFFIKINFTYVLVIDIALFFIMN